MLEGLIMGVIAAVVGVIWSKVTKNKIKNYNEANAQQVSNESEVNQSFSSNAEDTLSVTHRESLLDEIGAPEGVTIGEDGYPSQYINGVDVYKVKAFKHDDYFHRPDCERASSDHYEEYNFAYIWTSTRFGHKPCPHCKPYFPDASWFYKYPNKVEDADILGFLKNK